MSVVMCPHHAHEQDTGYDGSRVVCDTRDHDRRVADNRTETSGRDTRHEVDDPHAIGRDRGAVVVHASTHFAADSANGGLDPELVHDRGRQLPEHGCGAVPPKRSSVPAGGSSIEMSTVTCGSSAGKNPTKLE